MRITLLSAALFASGLASAATPVDGWYASAFGGYTYLPPNIDRYTFDLYRDGSKYNGGYNVGGRVGYQSNPIRYEGEYTFLYANLKGFDVNYVRQNYVSGFSSANLLMANIYYDFPEMLPAISPYLGVGIGYAYLQASLTSVGPNHGFTYFETDDNAFAYQGTAGLTYNFAENYAATLSYRYVASDKTSNFGRVFQMHMANAGVVYRFDRGTYK